MTPLLGIHHVALICADYDRSRDFYVRVLGLTVKAEHHRAARDSWKLDLALPDGGQLHLAFRVAALEPMIERLAAEGVPCEPIRVDEYTGQRFTFFADPDGLPLELYETT